MSLKNFYLYRLKEQKSALLDGIIFIYQKQNTTVASTTRKRKSYINEKYCFKNISGKTGDQ